MCGQDNLAFYTQATSLSHATIECCLQSQASHTVIFKPRVMCKRVYINRDVTLGFFSLRIVAFRGATNNSSSFRRGLQTRAFHAGINDPPLQTTNVSSDSSFVV